MHVHILGICGTFMGGIAALARATGHRVTGSDQNVYPPMSTQLEALGIDIDEGYDPAVLEPAPDCVIVGNAMSRGNPCVEAMLDRGLPYTSGPQWLAEHVLQSRWVLAVAGTHGKTTTASMLAWILEHAGLDPGFLIGGVPGNFGISARLGTAPFFVVEADEYDTAFFDKRSKFVHYRPRTAVLNNLEFDHADIFDDLEAIKRQFHHLVRTVPQSGRIVCNAASDTLKATLAMGCWTPVEHFAVGAEARWRVDPLAADTFGLAVDGRRQGTAQWPLRGTHNLENAAAACAAAHHAGVPAATSLAALGQFAGVKRRLERRGEINGVAVYDDFAHHPTAIAYTLDAVRGEFPEARVVAVLEPRSNTMKMGYHQQTLAGALSAAAEVWLFRPTGMTWDLDAVASELGARARILDDVDRLAEAVAAGRRSGDQVIIMSNGGFGGLHDKLLEALARQVAAPGSPGE